jgi:hypothetical protein
LKNRRSILIYLTALIPFLVHGQNNTFSPYSRYGIGEMSQSTFAHNAAMGGANIALRSDSTMPIFINVGNPASYPFIRLTTLEVGGTYLYSQFKGDNNTSLTKWNTNFAYGALGFPIRSNGGACFGIMPYTSVGYETQNIVTDPIIGDIQYKFSGDGGLSKAFIGYGIMPFKRRLTRFRSRNLYVPDSLKALSHRKYMRREKANKLLSDFSIGLNVDYIFGTMANTTRIIYPNSLTFNDTYRERVMTLGDFTGNFGMQTALTIDSVGFKGHKRVLKEKVKLTFGYFMALNNTLKGGYFSGVYNYVLNGAGQEIMRDTVLYDTGHQGTVKLPLEQGFGLGIKKGERINIVTDFAITNWQNFRYLGAVSDFKKNYRMAAGINYVPEKYAAGSGAFFKRVNYRLGVSYQTGYLYLKNSLLTDYFVSAGVGLPVGIGRLSSMVNVSAQYGIMSTGIGTLISQNYWRINFGFTFCDRWFQKFRYD